MGPGIFVWQKPVVFVTFEFKGRRFLRHPCEGSELSCLRLDSRLRGNDEEPSNSCVTED